MAGTKVQHHAVSRDLPQEEASAVRLLLLEEAGERIVAAWTRALPRTGRAQSMQESMKSVELLEASRTPSDSLLKMP